MSLSTSEECGLAATRRAIAIVSTGYCFSDARQLSKGLVQSDCRCSISEASLYSLTKSTSGKSGQIFCGMLAIAHLLGWN